MSIRSFRPGWLVLTLALASPAWAEETIESIEKRLNEAGEKVKSLSFKMTMVTESKFEGGYFKNEGSATHEYVKKDAKTTLYRNDMKNSTVTKMGDQEEKQDATTLSVCDGQYVYTLTDSMGQKYAIKNKAEGMQNQFDAKATFASLKGECDLKVLPDEKVDGKECFVIEATPKQADDAVSKMVLHFSKETGLTVKSVTLGKDGKPISTVTISDIKVNSTIAPDRFVWKAPEGVEMQDMTGDKPARGEPKP